jgi:hypothetical protein
MAARTIEAVERDLRRAGRAVSRLRRDVNRLTRDIAKNGGVVPNGSNGVLKASPALRQLREINRAIKHFGSVIKLLDEEKATMTVKVEEKADAYNF